MTAVLTKADRQTFAWGAYWLNQRRNRQLIAEFTAHMEVCGHCRNFTTNSAALNQERGEPNCDPCPAGYKLLMSRVYMLKPGLLRRHYTRHRSSL